MSKHVALVFVPIGIGLNVVGGLLASALKLPVFLDTIGTMLVAALLGPWWGALAGGLTNVIMSLQNPMDMWFAVVNIVVGLVVGLASRRFGFNRLPVVLAVGAVLAVLCPAIGSLIAAYVYGGLTGGGIDVFVGGLMAAGTDVFTAAFIPRLGSNLVDKVLSAVLVLLIVRALPRSMAGYARGPKPRALQIA